MESGATQKIPLIIKRNKISVLKKDCFINDSALLRCMKGTRPVIVREDVLYRSEPGDFMKGEYPNLTITNRQNILANISRTTAKYTHGSVYIERTSDSVAKLIGQKNYDTVFTALCSVISQELRIQGLLALLTVQKAVKTNSCQTIDKEFDKKVGANKSNLIDVGSQTDETCSDLLQRLKIKRKIKKPQSTPYVITKSSAVKKLVIKPQQFEVTKNLIKEKEDKLAQQDVRKIGTRKVYGRISNSNSNCTKVIKSEVKIEVCSDQSSSLSDTCESNVQRISESTLPEIRSIVDEDSNISDTSYGNISISSCRIPLLLENPNALLNDIDKYTQEPVGEFTLTMMDGSHVKIRGKPEDHFHIATTDILKHLSPNDQTKVVWHQAYIDWKYCLQRDEDFNLPIHIAVLNNDVDLIRRQCVVLKNRQESVDVRANNNLTALQMSILQDSAACTSVLLQHGANLLTADEEQRTLIHHAAEVSPDHLKVVINYCQKNARYILQENEMWKPELEEKSEGEIAKYLLSKICRLYDNQGYTPLMIASKLGNYTNVKVLLDADPDSVNLPMPNCGNTALYEAVYAACVDAENSTNQSKAAEHFLKTAEVLVKYGADPAIENNSGSSVNIMLNEFRLSEMSMIIANAIVSTNFPASVDVKDAGTLMLVREVNGGLNLQDLRNARKTENTKETKTTKRLVINPIPAKKPLMSNVTQVPKKSPQEIIIYGNKTMEEAPKQITPPVKSTSRIIIPVNKSTRLSVDKQKILNKTLSKTTTPIVVSVKKLDLNRKLSLVSVAGSSATSSDEPDVAKGSVKRATVLVKSRDVPIKKQKRDSDQT